MALSEYIKKMRNLKGMRQNEIAERLNLTLPTYSRRENSGSFTEAELKTLAEIFEVEPAELISLVGKGKAPGSKIVQNANSLIVERVLRIEAMQKVLLASMAELLSHSRNVDADAVYFDLQTEVANELNELMGEL